MTTNSRDSILNKLRQARPFEDALPRPKSYLDVTIQDDVSPAALLDRFCVELLRLQAEHYVVSGDDAARAQVIDLMRSHDTRRIIAWDFAYIPVTRLREAVEAEGIEIIFPDTHNEMREEALTASEGAEIGLTGADAAAATTGTLIFTTAPGKGRIPTVLAPVHIAVITLDQLVPRLESWVAAQRANGMQNLTNAANFCFVSGPSRTGDIEMELILGVHGPARVQVVIMT